MLTGSIGVTTEFNIEKGVILKERCNSYKNLPKNRLRHLRDVMGETMRVENEAAKASGVQIINPCVHHGCELIFYPISYQNPLKVFKKRSGMIKIA